MTVPLFDAMIHCEIAGYKNAPALVFLHGNGEDLSIFDSQVRYFSQFYRTVTIDTRGHGRSSRGESPFNFNTFATDLADIFEALVIEKAHIVGFSDGAIIAMYFAISHPERVASLVLLGANYHPKGLRFFPRLHVKLVYAGLSVASLFSEKKRQRKEIWGLMVNQPELTIDDLSRITTPSLIITGENDMISQDHTDEMCHAIAGSHRLVIPKGNHYWMFKKPELFNQCIVDFLNSL